MKSQWFQILLSLADRALHGSAIMEEVLDRTDGAMKLWPGALYGALSDLSDAGLIEEVGPPAGAPTEGGKRRFYRITASGRVAVAEEARRLASYVDVARSKKVLGVERPV